MSTCWLLIPRSRGLPEYEITHRSTVSSSYTVSDLLVNCLGGPLIDTWDGDWFLNPASDMWQPTPSLLITSFTQATGLLCLGPHNTAFSEFVLRCSVCPLSHTHRSRHKALLLLLCTYFNFWLLVRVWKAANSAALHISSIWINFL